LFSTVLILAGFALMLFLPCAFALLGTIDKDGHENSSYADRAFARGGNRRPAATAAAKPPQDRQVAARAQTRAQLRPESQVRSGALPRSPWGDLSDPSALKRMPSVQPGRILRAEIAALRANAAAARAHAAALEAVAQAALARASAAALEATVAEGEAAAAIHEVRRAA
jgi:hypothetical protein